MVHDSGLRMFNVRALEVLTGWTEEPIIKSLAESNPGNDVFTQ